MTGGKSQIINFLIVCMLPSWLCFPLTPFTRETTPGRLMIVLLSFSCRCPQGVFDLVPLQSSLLLLICQHNVALLVQIDRITIVTNDIIKLKKQQKTAITKFVVELTQGARSHKLAHKSYYLKLCLINDFKSPQEFAF